MENRRVLLGLMAAFTLAMMAPVQAQDSDYPSRPIKLIIPYTPATGADILARLMGPKISDHWKVPVVTENRPGASSILGAEIVANSPADGYTFLFTATSFGTSVPLANNLPYDPLKSFAPVGLIATSVLSVCVHPDVPAKTLKEFIELARSEPGKLNYASPGNGTPQHLAMELLKLEANLDIVHVPYKASAGATTDLLGGHVQAMVVPLQTIAPYVHSGTIRMLAVMSAERSAAFADVPTMRESGFPEFVVETWYGAFAPAGTPPRAVAKLNGEINALLKEGEMRDALNKQGMNVGGGPPERMGKLLSDELVRWKRVVAAAKIQAD
jgi:tripartite-type tricarboxylate transporter receptor subunit TctC